jgi:hypothetical protein
MDDLYKLVTFVQRSVLVSVRTDSAKRLDAALAALTAIDHDRVDWRDVTTAAGLLSWAMVRAGLDAGTAFERAASAAEPGVAKTLRRFAAQPETDLGSWGHRLVASSDGPVLPSSLSHPYDPTVDLLAVATALETVVRADGYRVTSVIVGSDIAGVWLTGGDTEAVQAALHGMRACVVVHGSLNLPSVPDASSQMLIMFVVETATEEAARTLAAAAVPKTLANGSFAALGVAAGTLCCVLVARSVQSGVANHERTGSLARFTSAVRDALEGAHS